MVNTLFAALGRGTVRYRWIIVVVWVLGTVVAVRALPSLSSQVDNNNSAFLPANAPSNQAAILAEPLIGSINQAPSRSSPPPAARGSPGPTRPPSPGWRPSSATCPP